MNNHVQGAAAGRAARRISRLPTLRTAGRPRINARVSPEREAAAVAITREQIETPVVPAKARQRAFCFRPSGGGDDVTWLLTDAPVRPKE
jgi:hypothetical protein